MIEKIGWEKIQVEGDEMMEEIRCDLLAVREEISCAPLAVKEEISCEPLAVKEEVSCDLLTDDIKEEISYDEEISWDPLGDDKNFNPVPDVNHITVSKHQISEMYRQGDPATGHIKKIEIFHKKRFCDYCPCRGRPSQKYSTESFYSVMNVESEFNNYVINEMVYLRPGFLQGDSYLCTSCYDLARKKYNAYKRGEEYVPMIRKFRKEKFCDYCPNRGYPFQKSIIEKMYSVMKMNRSEFKNYLTNIMIMDLQPEFMQEDSYLCRSCLSFVKNKYEAYKRDKEKFCDYCPLNPYGGLPEKSSTEKMYSVMNAESEFKKYVINEIVYLRPGFLQGDSYLCSSCYQLARRKYNAYKRGEEYVPMIRKEKPVRAENKIKSKILGVCAICKKNVTPRDNHPRLRKSRPFTEYCMKELDFAGIQYNSVLETMVHITCFEKIRMNNVNVKKKSLKGNGGRRRGRPRIEDKGDVETIEKIGLEKYNFRERKNCLEKIYFESDEEMIE